MDSSKKRFTNISTFSTYHGIYITVCSPLVITKTYRNSISHKECLASGLIVRQLQLFPRRCPCSPWLCARICCNCAGAFKWLFKMVGDVHLQRNPSRALSSEDKRAPLLFHAVFLPFCLVPFSFHPSVPSTPTKTNSENECPRVTRYTVFFFFRNKYHARG